MRIDFQALRHLKIASLVRRLVYRCLIDKESWPPTFRAPRGSWSPSGCEDLYVHLPFCRQICPHCPYNKERLCHQQVEPYRRKLISELRQYLESGKAVPVNSLYFGGGTPSATPSSIEDVITTLRPVTNERCQIAVEVHPNDASHKLLDRLLLAGVTRISLGIETLDPKSLRKLGRNYTPEQGMAALRRALSKDFELVDVNQIYAIPGLTIEQSLHDTRAFLAAGIHQLSAYPLFSFAHTRMGNRAKDVVDDRERSRTQKLISKTCRAAGMERTSVWSYTQSGHEPYSTVTRENYRGLGAGAGSKVGGVFWFNTFSVSEYCRQIEARPALIMDTSRRFRRFHWLYWQLYLTRLNPETYFALFGTKLEADFPLLLRLLRWTNLMGRDYRLTERGSYLVHRLQLLYSLTYIDRLWKACQREPWPDKVVLD